MKRLLILTICFMFIKVTISFAESLPAKPLPEYAWEIGAEWSDFTYKEPDVMEDNGTMQGVNFSYTYRGWSIPQNSEIISRMSRIEGRYSWGEVDYENSGTIDDIDDYIFEIRGLVGNDYSVFDASILTFYIGFGYRYLNDNTSGRISSTGASGYKRESNYYYVPTGIEIITDLDKGWFLGATLEYDILVQGKQRSHLSDVDPNFNDLENDQNSGFGCRGSIKIIKKAGMIDFIIEPFIRYWNIKKSEDANISYAGLIWGYGY